MKTLAFLDMSQNSLRELPGPEGDNTFKGLDALTALNIERNLIQTLHENAFLGVRKSLSSPVSLTICYPIFQRRL